MQTLYAHIKNIRADGSIDTMQTLALESKHVPLYCHQHGLMQTATGYGKRIATATMVKFNGKWRRVYCCIYSNIGTCYIGKLSSVGEVITISLFRNQPVIPKGNLS